MHLSLYISTVFLIETTLLGNIQVVAILQASVLGDRHAYVGGDVSAAQKVSLSKAPGLRTCFSCFSRINAHQQRPGGGGGGGGGGATAGGMGAEKPGSK